MRGVQWQHASPGYSRAPVTPGYSRRARAVADRMVKRGTQEKRARKIKASSTPAAELRDDAGWKVSEDDGLRYKTIGGKETRLAFKIEFPTAAKLAPQVARALQEDLKAVGILVETPAVEYMTLRTNLLAGKFDAYIMGWGSGTDPDTSRNIWHSSVIDKPGGRNYVGFANARVDDLFEQGRKEMDPAKRKLIYQEMHRLVYQDQPYLFICTIPTMWAFNKRIRGVYFSPRGIAGYHPGIRDWWVHVDDAK